MTKSETIFRNILREAKSLVKFYGQERCEEMNIVCNFDTEGCKDEFISQRTVNDVTKQLDKYISRVKIQYRCGRIDDEKLKLEAAYIRLVKSGIARGQEYVDEIKSF